MGPIVLAEWLLCTVDGKEGYEESEHDAGMVDGKMIEEDKAEYGV